jgi:hypothetical protein
MGNYAAGNNWRDLSYEDITARTNLGLAPVFQRLQILDAGTWTRHKLTNRPRGLMPLGSIYFKNHRLLPG